MNNLKAKTEVADSDSENIPQTQTGHRPLSPDFTSTKDWLASFGIGNATLIPGVDIERDFDEDGPVRFPAHSLSNSFMCFADFVQTRFIPEYVEQKTPAGKSHFRSILKYIMHSGSVLSFSASEGEKEKSKVAANPDWPYLGASRMCDIGAQHIERLTSAAINAGYSTQTVVHMRNVVRAVFSHALRTGCYHAPNPAALVTLPAMARKERHKLTLMELKRVMQLMRYPEKHLALFAILTDLNMAEMCALQWKYINVSNELQEAEGEVIPPRKLAVRYKLYRGNFAEVIGNRRRFISSSDLLSAVLRDLRSRKRFTGQDDFVFASQAGTPIHPENIAARRLKAIGKAAEMPWLSWCVFQRTRDDLQNEFGRRLHRELERILPLGISAPGAPRFRTIHL